MLRSFVEIANRLFIEISKEFSLDFVNNSYCLSNPYDPKCHILEIALISNSNFTGNKILDLKSILNVDEKWILGFYHGFKGLPCKFNHTTYVTGHFLGERMDKIVRENQNFIPI